MVKQTVAIVGLGKVGSVFLQELLKHSDKDIKVVAVAEKNDTAGRAMALDYGIPNLEVDALMARGESIDILFDLTGVPAVRRELREKMMLLNNTHTVIATESIARLIWSLISNGEILPAHVANAGY